MSDYIVSPILSATPFVGQHEPHKTQEGKLWLYCAQYGFSFCVAEIDEAFQPINHGDVVRLHVSLDQRFGYKPLSLNEATNISPLADQLLFLLFEGECYGDYFDEAVIDHYGLDDEDFDSSVDGFPEELKVFYRVVRV